MLLTFLTIPEVPFIKRVHSVLIWLPWVDHKHNTHALKLVLSCLKKKGEKKCSWDVLVPEFQRKFTKAQGLCWWGLQGTPYLSVVVGILVITQGPKHAGYINWLDKREKLFRNTHIRSLFSLTWSSETKSTFTFVWLGLWKQMPENLKKFFHRQGSCYMFLFQG